jgi:hypothetical protein
VAGKREEMTTYALTRVIRNVTHYLNERYQWQRLPHVFDEVHFSRVVFAEAMQYRDRPQRVGELLNSNLDSAVWTELR